MSPLRFLALPVAALLFGAAPARAAAEPTGAGSAVSSLRAERDRVRAELDRTNAEIGGLKRGDRGVGDDYRLRRKMAEAEALARRLTAIEADLPREGGAAPVLAAPLVPAPPAEPGDGPAELEAKADILADQARRLSNEAAQLARAASDIRGRQTLRRRVGQLERDPFAGLEGAKRNMVVAGPRAAPPRTAGGERAQTVPPAEFSTGTSDSQGASGGPGAASSPSAPPRTSVTPTAPSSPVPAGGGGTAPGAAPGPGPGSKGAGAESTSPPPGAGGPLADLPQLPQAGGEAASTGLTLKYRALLDPESLAQVQRLEGSGDARRDPEALERAAAALRARAQRLEADSRALRTKVGRPAPSNARPSAKP
jgi:hypothetical protein